MNKPRNEPMEDEHLFPDDGQGNAAPDDEEESLLPADELPPITTVSIDLKDSRGIHYQGAFVFKVPTMRDEIEIGRRKSLLLPISVVNDVNAIMLAEMIAYLDVTIQKGEKGERLPKWWAPLDFYDAAPIAALYAEVTAYARRFRNEPDPVIGPAARKPARKSRQDGRGAVDGDVPPAVERRTISRTDGAGSSSAGASRRSPASRKS
jgi:hypothetical protein